MCKKFKFSISIKWSSRTSLTSLSTKNTFFTSAGILLWRKRAEQVSSPRHYHYWVFYWSRRLPWMSYSSSVHNSVELTSKLWINFLKPSLVCPSNFLWSLRQCYCEGLVGVDSPRWCWLPCSSGWTLTSSLMRLWFLQLITSLHSGGHEGTKQKHCRPFGQLRALCFKNTCVMWSSHPIRIGWDTEILRDSDTDALLIEGPNPLWVFGPWKLKHRFLHSNLMTTFVGHTFVFLSSLAGIFHIPDYLWLIGILSRAGCSTQEYWRRRILSQPN